MPVSVWNCVNDCDRFEKKSQDTTSIVVICNIVQERMTYVGAVSVAAHSDSAVKTCRINMIQEELWLMLCKISRKGIAQILGASLQMKG